MNTIEIFSDENNGLTENESISKGYRNDIYVKIEDSYFRLAIYSITRIRQDFETEMESSGYFATPPNLVLVKEVSTSEIKSTINNLFQKEVFFEELKPFNLSDEATLRNL